MSAGRLASYGITTEVLNAQKEESVGVGGDDDVMRMDGKPDNIPQHVWDLIRENGELATTRLNEILRSPRFHRLRAGDQAKLIALAQTRAYGAPASAQKEGGKRRGMSHDVVQAQLDTMAYRASLPEYFGTAANEARRKAESSDSE